jgi:hypothetical protein
MSNHQRKRNLALFVFQPINLLGTPRDAQQVSLSLVIRIHVRARDISTIMVPVATPLSAFLLTRDPFSFDRGSTTRCNLNA